MARDYIHIGPCPPDEDAVQIAEGSSKMRAECQRYIVLLRQWFGPEPKGALLSIKREGHDFGDYYEVICHYESELDESVAYAFACEGGAGPMRWGKVGITVGANGVETRYFTPDDPQYPQEALASTTELLRREDRDDAV